MTDLEVISENKKPAYFFKQKIVMNASLAYGILLGIIAERYLVEIGRSEKGVLLYFLASAFFLMLLLAAFWGKAVKNKIEAEKSWLKRYLLHLKEPYAAWALLLGYMVGAVIWRFLKWS